MDPNLPPLPSATWPQVALELVRSLPQLIAAIGAVTAAGAALWNGRASRLRGEASVAAVQASTARVAEVHDLVNSEMSETKAKLDAALGRIRVLTGEDEADEPAPAPTRGNP